MKNLQSRVDTMKNFYIETKYDGERCQLHKKGDQFKFFSRNGFDFTYDYGETATEHGKFSSYFVKSINDNITDLIVDGEMCAWSKEDNRILWKSEQMNIRQIRDDDPKVQQCLVLYDLVLVNDKLYCNTPLQERLEILEDIIKVQEGGVMLGKR